MRRYISPLCATPIAGALLVVPAQAQHPRAGVAQQGPIPEPVSAAANPHPSTGAAARGEAEPAARGRRIVSTAFVRLGPDGQMLVRTRKGRVLVLRSVTMEQRAVCGVAAAESMAGKRRCIDYAQVTQARPVDLPARVDPVDAGPGQRATERAPGPKR